MSGVWTLIVFFMLPDGSEGQTKMGVMVNEPLCNIAGLGVAIVLQTETPGLVVGWTCDPVGVAA